MLGQIYKGREMLKWIFGIGESMKKQSDCSMRLGAGFPGTSKVVDRVGFICKWMRILLL